jgi:CRP/FNR family cyclic AMP-dependent transcriptional regulator
VSWRLLAGVPEEELRHVLAVAKRRRFGRGEVVFHRDDPADSMHLIATGRFAVQVTTPLGDTAMIGIHGPGESFGELALVLGGGRRAATVVALEPAETFAVYVDDFDRLRTKYSTVDAFLLGFLTRELRRLNERLIEALYVSSERRVLRRLVELHGLYPRGRPIPLTQAQIASLAGASRATVNRVLREEEARGTLELHRGRAAIVDQVALARRALVQS